MQELKTSDHRLRRTFADWAYLKLAEYEHFYQNIMTSIEIDWCGLHDGAIMSLFLSK